MFFVGTDGVGLSHFHCILFLFFDLFSKLAYRMYIFRLATAGIQPQPPRSWCEHYTNVTAEQSIGIMLTPIVRGLWFDPLSNQPKYFFARILCQSSSSFIECINSYSLDKKIFLVIMKLNLRIFSNLTRYFKYFQSLL